MITATTKSSEDTRDLGAALAAVVRASDLVLVSGELGAGKTTLAQGFGRGLGVHEPIVSPTFTLVRPYAGRLPFVHCDVYRLEDLDEAADLDLAEALDAGAVALVEWGEVIAPVLPPDFLDVRMEFGDGDDDRRIRLHPVGTSWSARMGALRAGLGRWAT